MTVDHDIPVPPPAVLSPLREEIRGLAVGTSTLVPVEPGADADERRRLRQRVAAAASREGVKSGRTYTTRWVDETPKDAAPETRIEGVRVWRRT